MTPPSEPYSVAGDLVGSSTFYSAGVTGGSPAAHGGRRRARRRGAAAQASVSSGRSENLDGQRVISESLRATKVPLWTLPVTTTSRPALN